MCDQAALVRSRSTQAHRVLDPNASLPRRSKSFKDHETLDYPGAVSHERQLSTMTYVPPSPYQIAGQASSHQYSIVVIATLKGISSGRSRGSSGSHFLRKSLIFLCCISYLGRSLQLHVDLTLGTLRANTSRYKQTESQYDDNCLAFHAAAILVDSH